MSNASKDDNRESTILGVSKIDLSTPITIAVNPVNNGVIVELG